MTLDPKKHHRNMSALAIVPLASQGSQAGDPVLTVYDTGGANVKLQMSNEGQLIVDNIQVSQGIISGALGGVTGSLEITGVTSGGITITPIAAGTNTTTIQNQSGGSAKIITLPSATCTLPGLGLDNTWTGTNTFAAMNLNGGFSVDTDSFVVADITGILTLHGGATIDNNTDLAICNITETTVRVTGILDVTGNSTLASLDVGGGFTTASGSGLTVAATGALSTNGAIVTESTIVSGKTSAIQGGITVYGGTSGSIAITPIAAGTNATTIQNQSGGSAKVITLPSATSTLPGLELANTWTGATNSFNGSVSGGIVIQPLATGNAATTIQNQNVAAAVITLPSATCTLPGLGLANAFTAVNTFTVTGTTDADLKGIYSNVNQTTLATANDLTAVRGNARIDVDSASGKAIGGYFLAGNTTAGFNVSIVRGIYCGTVCKTPTAADKTWTDVRGIEIVTGNTAIGATYKTDITNLMGIRLKIGSSTGSGTDVCGDITNGYGVWVDHEQQGLACRTLDAGFYLSATSISGGNAAWAYGLDMSAVGTNMGTADIRLSQGETIDNLTNGTINLTGTTIKATGALDVTGAVTCAGALTATSATEVTTGTVRALIGQVTASGTNMTNPLLTGVRGLVTLSGTTTGSASAYMYGTQGKFICTGTMNDAANWATGVYAQLDLSAGVYTAAQIAGLWVDMGAAANASAKSAAPTMIDCIRVTCTPSGFKPKAVLSVTANATNFLDFGVADGTPGWYEANSVDIAAGGSLCYVLRVKTPTGGTGYIPILNVLPT